MTHHEQNGEDELQAARRTAYALGQISGAERAEVSAELDASPKVRQEVQDVEALAARLKEAAHEARQPEAAPALRAVIERRLAELDAAAGRAVAIHVARKPARRLWRRRLTALALVASLVALAVPIERSMKSPAPGKQREVAKEAATPAPAVVDRAKRADKEETAAVGQRNEHLAKLVGQYNDLILKQRYDEAEVVAKRAQELAPHELVSQVMAAKSSLLRRMLRDGVKSSEHAFSDTLANVDETAIPLAAHDEKGVVMFNPAPGTISGPRPTWEVENDHNGIRDSSFDIAANSSATFGGAITGATTIGALTRAGTGVLVLAGSNSFAGNSELVPEAIFGRYYGDVPVNTAANVYNGAATISGSGAMTISAGTLQLANDANGTFSSQNNTGPGQDRLPSAPNIVIGALSGDGPGQTVPAGSPGVGTGVLSMEYNPTRRASDSRTGSGSGDAKRGRDGEGYVANQPALGFKSNNGGDLAMKDDYSVDVTAPFGDDPVAHSHVVSPSKVEFANGATFALQRIRTKNEQVVESANNAPGFNFKNGGDLGDPSLRPQDVAGLPANQSATSKPKPVQKPVESWKPAHVVPNSSRLMVGDKEELPLKGMQVDVRVDGFRARVLIDLYYFNDRPQQLEGSFQLRLPDEASPYFFAFGRTVYQAPQVTANDSMFFKPQQVSQGDTTPEKILALRGNSWEQPKVARMVPKEKAALAYRDTVRRRVDPALVEWSGAGVFQCRVFPLAPQSLHRVTIGYDVDLTRVGDDLELRLDLPEQTPATIVDLNIAASDARQVSLDAPATALAAGPSGQPSRLSYRLIDPKERPLAVRLRKPGTQMLTGNDEATGNYFATRVGLPLPATPASDRAKQAVFLVDASLSAGPQFPLWTKLLRATLRNNRDSIKEFAVLFFNVETFWWQEKFVANTPDNVDALVNYADGLALEGATDLGRALKEAASPSWRGTVDAGTPADLFLLSDGAATWGEDRWGLLASVLTHGPSTAGERRSALFAYRTGLAGGDPRLLAYLAEQTGGAVFSLVGEAEIASASVAHRNRPWRLTGIEMAGAHDLLVAGRPQNVFPGQQLLVVGRLETSRVRSSAAMTHQESPESGGSALRPATPNNNTTTPYNNTDLTFTLQQGKTTQTISVKMDQVVASELAARTFGQVATSQLEDVSGAAAAAEPVATAYARHFRVTGRTCSLLMLESEQDYARFNIKPEEDDFVVKDQPAGPIVAKAAAEVTAAMSDPKASFLAWYRRVCRSPEVHFDLPAALNVALETLPAETFAVAAPPLCCKLRMQSDLPEALRQPWRSGLPDYETLAGEAQRRLTAYGSDDALRVLSSLVEERPGDAALQRDLAFSAIEWQRPGEAYHLLRRAGAGRTFEPVTFHALAHCLEQMGQADLAIIYYELACGGQWDVRFGDMHNIAQLDYYRFLRRVAGGGVKTVLADYAKARLATLAAMQLRDRADVAALVFWNTDGTDVDLHVIEPSGEECFYQHTQTASGGHISRDVTTGYGPELYLLPAAPAGKYRVSAHYFASDANRASTRTKVLALIYEGWGTKEERLTVKAVALTGQSESHELATLKR